MPGAKRMANIWQGEFPNQNLKEDGFATTAPVKSFPANGYGLYDTIGNIWEWCSDFYDVAAYQALERSAKDGVCENPTGPLRAANPDHPDHLGASQRVIRGGSFLCAENDCRNYRPSARHDTDWDTGLSNLGFRCVKDVDVEIIPAKTIAPALTPAPKSEVRSRTPTKSRAERQPMPQFERSKSMW